MSADPQYTRFPDLSLAQHVFNLSNEYCPPSTQQSSLTALKNAIMTNTMAPFYRHVAHPTEGILGPRAAAELASESGAAAQQDREAAVQRQRAAQRTGKTAVASDMLAVRKGGTGGSPVVQVPWDEKLYESLVRQNEERLQALQKEEDEAAEAAGETEVQAARGQRAELYSQIGDKEKSVASLEALLDKTGVLGTKIDIVLAITRIGLFFGDKLFVKKTIDRAQALVDSGGDWDRRNRLKAYKGLYLLTVRAYSLAAPLLLDSLSTFTSYELCSYSSLVIYAVLAGSLALKRVDFKAKVVDAPEIRAILGEGAERLSALSGSISSGPGAGDEEMHDVAAVNLTALGTEMRAESEAPMDFSPLANLVASLYNGLYRTFFLALAAVEDRFLTQDRFLYEHRSWFVREMRLRGYQQLLQSYRVVGLASMAADFGVTIDYLDR